MQGHDNFRGEVASGGRARSFALKRGSVLILAVAMLVLLAAIGVAYMSVTRDERFTSIQNVANTQIDLLVQGVIAMTKSVITNEVFDPSQSPNTYRPIGSTTYQPWDCSFPATGSTNYAGTWLADRIPTVNANNTVVWNAISWPLVSNFTGGGYQFDLPNSASAHLLSFPKHQFAPATSILLNGTRYPTLQEYNGTTAVGSPFVAADADGDGIADSGLVKLWQSNGITYYYAMRIVDNNSAINANTAWGQIHDFAGNETTGTQQNKGYFPSNIGFRELLASYNSATQSCPEIDTLNLLRFGYGSGPGPGYAATTPIDDSGSQRTDFNFSSQGDAFWMQAGRRLDNPGHNTASSYYSPLAWSEMAPIGFDMCLRDPSQLPGLLESNLTQTLYTSTPVAAYDPDSFGGAGSATARNWYNENFDYGGNFALPNWNVSTGYVAGQRVTYNTNSYQAITSSMGVTPPNAAYWNPIGSMNVRPLLVTRNGVNISAPPVYAPGTTGPVDTTNMPAYDTPVQSRCSLNTATFGELYRTFWEIMACPNSTIATGSCPPWLADEPNSPANAQYDPFFAVKSPYIHPQHMFRSPIRDPRTPSSSIVYYTPQTMLQIRAAMAALNVLQMRSGTNDVQSIHLQYLVPVNGTGNHPTEAVLNSVAPQPYITRVYVQTDTVTKVSGKNNPVGYYAIELYNPYPFAIPMQNWVIGTINRTTASYPGNDTSTLATFSPTYPTIPANGHLILENLNPTTPTGNDATYRPASAHFPSPLNALNPRIKTFYVAGLDGIRNLELVIFRPRAFNCVLNTTTFYEDQNIDWMVPVDNFDLFGLPAPAQTAAVVWHYCRPNGFATAWSNVASYYIDDLVTENGTTYQAVSDNVGKDPASNGAIWKTTTLAPNWQFVYPGRYNASPSVTKLRQDGTFQGTFNPLTQADPWAVTTPAPNPPILLGGGSPVASYAVASGGISPVFTIQLDSFGWPGANPIGASGNAYPFGSFGRNGDLLDVPFLGSYTAFLHQDNGNQKVKGFYEANSVSMDCSFADDADPSDDAEEQVGRFCPLTSSDLVDDRAGTTTAATTTVLTDPTRVEGNYLTPGSYYYYAKILTGPAAGQTRQITAASAGSVTVSPAFTTNPLAGASYIITKTAQGTVGSPTAMTVTDANRIEPSGYWIGWDLNIVSGSGAGQSQIVSAFAAGVLTVYNSWTTNPTAASTYTLTRNRYNWQGNFPTPPQSSVTSATVTTVVDTTRQEPDSYWVGWNLNIVSGPGVGQSQPVTGFTSSTHTLTVANNWAISPTAASAYTLTRNQIYSLFDRFNVLNPNDDYLPNLDPNNAIYSPGSLSPWVKNTTYPDGSEVSYASTNYICTYATGAPASVSPPPASYWTTYWSVLPAAPMPVANSIAGVANGGKEGNGAVDGLININTAPWPVLAMLPMVANKSDSLGAIDTVNNIKLAKAIVAYRNATGPFQSIYDLNKVVDFTDTTKTFQNGYGTITFDNTLANDPGSTQGDFSGNGLGGTDGVRQDFEEKFLMLNRISNLITTRSDSFTVYILVQGWSGVPGSPTLVVQRRAAYVCDRSKLSSLNKAINMLNVPVN